jgi:dTDP-glucose 4,6-dehydratase/UDP-glucose 4-epimerase
MKKILIIGSKGFIGSHAVDYFSSSNKYQCWGADVVTDYVNNNYFLIDGSNSNFNELFEQHKFDVCINCSGAASVPDSLKHPLRDFYLNVTNVAKLLEAIKHYNHTCKFINLSSAAVYGNPVQLPIKEEDVCRPVSPYGQHKLMAEQLCGEYHQYFGLQTCLLRIFSAYGPGLQKQLLWDIFLKTKQGNTVNLFGTGNETRDFIYVEDIVMAMECIITEGAFNASVYNIAGGEEISIKQIADELLHTLHYKGTIIFSGEERKGDPVNWKADITKLASLGFKHDYTLTKGIKKYVQWLKEVQ